MSMLLSYVQLQSILLFGIGFWIALNYFLTVHYIERFPDEHIELRVPFILCGHGAFTNAQDTVSDAFN